VTDAAARPADPRRRRLLASLTVGSLLLVLRRPAHAQTEDDRRLMARAFAMRQAALDQGDQPYGAVVVRDGRIIAEAPSRVVTRKDPTAHAEMEAIRDAARALGTNDLRGAVIYASSRPCPMCTAAAYWARVGRLYWGEAITDGGAPRPPSY